MFVCPRVVAVCFASALYALACSKSPDPAPAPAPEPVAIKPVAPAVTPVVAPTIAPAPSAAAAPDATASAAPGASTVPASASASPAASGSAGPKTFTCGAKGQPMCPMQGWMKGNMAPAAAAGDGEALAKALDYVAGKSPPGFGGWSGIARGGSAKAKAGDIDGAKQSCKTCHDQFKAKYKAEMRDRPF